ncbi:MAG: hypothetical protein U0791_07560 [Gemmataceae bacterium]
MFSKRWWLRAAIGLVLLAGVAVSSALWERFRTGDHGQRETTVALAEADATDPDWKWDALNAKRPRPPEGRNGADLVPQVKSKLPKDWGKRLNGEWDLTRDLPVNTRYPDEVLAEAKKECEAAKDAIAVARMMKDRPFGLRILVLSPNVIDTRLPDTQDTRQLVALLRWSQILAVETGDKQLAVDDLLAMLNVSRSLGDETFMISQLVRIACRTIASRSVEWTLAHTELPAERLPELQNAWAADAEEPLLLYALRGERAAMDVLMENLQTGRADPATWAEIGDAHRGPLGQLAWWYYRGRNLPGDRARILATFNTMIEVARKPIDEQPAAAAKFSQIEFDDEHRLHKLLFPAVEKVAAATWRSAAEMRCAIAGIACERYRMKTGRWPASLASLVPDHLPAVPIDPFDKQPLRFKKLPDGVLIYTVGTDRNDDGGDLRRADNPGGKDEGFRLWDVKERRKPAPEKPPEPKLDP